MLEFTMYITKKREKIFNRKVLDACKCETKAILNANSCQEALFKFFGLQAFAAFKSHFPYQLHCVWVSSWLKVNIFSGI